VTLYFIGIMAVFSAALIMYALWPKKDDQNEAIKRRMSGRRAQSNVAAIRQKAKESVAKRVIDTVVPIAVRPVRMNDAEEISKLRMQLATAGFRGENAPTMLLASKTILTVCLALAGAVFAWAKGITLLNGAGLTMICAGIGLLAPKLWLSIAISKRADHIRKGLPDALDMLVISVESGLGLDAAFQRVGDEMHHVHPVLAEELQLVTLESQMGIPRSEALANFAARTPIEETKSIVAVINQAERFGTSIGRALRNQSDALRTKRRQAAEERAQKTTVKLMAPLILFIFPAILVVLAGPAALKTIEAVRQTGLTD
jgi:tight adherence protein C